MKFLSLSEMMSQSRSKLLAIASGMLVAVFFFMLTQHPTSVAAQETRFFEVQSIDTMKFSRDMARDNSGSKEFQTVIDSQVKGIAATGVTHVAIATPYDEEFVPFLSEWVKAARKYKLNVWFRGNFAGWERWFDYAPISRDEHVKLTEQFILDNRDLFRDGDIFSSCPECENGGPGDPRQTGDIQGHREFLIQEYLVSQRAFNRISKRVSSNYFSMNGDVAELIMDKETTARLDGIVVIDHYVLTPEKLNRDINSIAEMSGGKIVLGEFGAPIPDIHGVMSETEQNDWIQDFMKLVSSNTNVVGVNYWTSHGSSTEIWDSQDKSKTAVQTITDYYMPTYIHGVVKNSTGKKLSDVNISVGLQSTITAKDGSYSLLVPGKVKQISYVKEGYNSVSVEPDISASSSLNIVLKSNEPSVVEQLLILFKKIFAK